MALVLATSLLALTSYTPSSSFGRGGAATALNQYPRFDAWASYHGKVYQPTERDYRYTVYRQNLRTIYHHNEHVNTTWKMAVNKFADMTAPEFRARFVGSYGQQKQKQKQQSQNTDGFQWNTTALPTSVDWTTKGAVTPVKNQQQCGSCWAFSSTGALEGAWFLANKTLPNLSEQQLVDCSTAQGNEGCNGGLMDYAFQYVIDNKGLGSEASYPYVATGPNTCKKVASVVKIRNFTDVPTNSEAALLAAVARQPVSVAVEADQDSFQFYSSGVMTKACGTALDHGVLAVGYGTLGGQNFYKVKNSWGADWGMKGYILLGRGSSYGASGQCGIQMEPSYPVV